MAVLTKTLDKPVAGNGAHAVPHPAPGERPAAYADRVGTWYGRNLSAEQRKAQGLFLTPVGAAAFMASLIAGDRTPLRILDPASGAGILLCAAVEALAARDARPTAVELVAYEIDEALIRPLQSVTRHLKAWAAEQGIELRTKVVHGDFVLGHAEALSGIGGLFPYHGADAEFDVIISNPPYFKIPKEGPHAQAALTVVHGQPNIYGLFMAVGAALLRQGGEFVFITPRSFASGPYFQQFRQQFFQMIRPEQVHVFGSRREAFSRDEVLQENVILRGVREDGWSRRKADHQMVITTSAGVGDLSAPVRRVERLAAILDLESKDKVLRLPVSSEDDDAIKLVDSWQGSLKAYGMNISTGPVVPFRALEFLEDVGEHPRTHAPLLWMQHVHALRVSWPNGCRKAQYIKDEPASRPLLVPNRNYVLMRRFSAKEEHRRLTAAPFLAKNFKGHWVGLENHLNYIHRPGGTLTEEETWGLAALLSSALLDTYFRISNGNTQVSATELRAMPLPDLDIIRALGRQAMILEDPAAKLDDLVMSMVCPPTKTRAKREPKRSRRWTKSSKPA